MQFASVLVAFVAVALCAGGVQGQNIPFEFVVVFTQEATDSAIVSHMSTVVASGSLVTHQYGFGSFRGYAVRVPHGSKLTDASNAFLMAEEVAYYEPNQIYRASAPIHKKPINTSSLVNADCSLQTGATWGLVRVAQEDLNIDGLYPWSPDSDGTGVSVYIVDTGIYLEHTDFEGRAIWGYDAVDDPSPLTDTNGHGTHVAGTVMSKTYGIAKKAKAVAVRVLGNDGSGTTAGVIAGIQFVATDGRGKKSAANMSLGGGKSTALNSAVASAVSVGIPFAVAAGNEAQDACNVSPASEPTAFTVACSTSSDSFCSFSNYGRCVDIIAPGQGITSTWINGPYSDNTISGTSMSSPHVAGIAARIISAAGTTLTPDQVQAQIDSIANLNFVRNVPQPGYTPNTLAHFPCS